MGLEVKESHACCPLVEVGHHFTWARVLYDALNHQSGSIGEDAGLVIVAIGMKGVHTIVAPHLGKELIFVDIQRFEVDQHCKWLARNFPSTSLDSHPLRQMRLRLPLIEHCASLLKERIVLIDIGTDENHLVFK